MSSNEKSTLQNNDTEEKQQESQSGESQSSKGKEKKKRKRSDDTAAKKKKKEGHTNKYVTCSFSMKVGIYPYITKNEPLTPLPSLDLQVKSVEELKKTIFEKYKHYLKGHSKVVEKTTEEDSETKTETVLDDEKEIQYSNSENFFRIKDDEAHRTFRLNDVKMSMLMRWSRKKSDLNLKIYPYGADISRTQYNQIKNKESVTACDRSGAKKEEEITKKVEELKNKLGDSWKAIDGVWRIWANDLVNNERENGEVESIQSPPKYLIHLFQTVDEHTISTEGYRRQKQNSIALTITKSLISKLEELKNTADLVESLLEQENEWIQETCYSSAYMRNIPNQEDEDHQ
jgi:hypothetical protein